MTRRGLVSGRRVPCFCCGGDPLAVTRGPRWRRCPACGGKGSAVVFAPPRGFASRTMKVVR